MIHYQLLNCGFFHADGGAMFGAIPKAAWSHRVITDEQNRCRMGMNCVLAWTDDRVILIDTGVGTKSLEELIYYDFRDTKDIRDLVIEAGFKPEEVTDVILTHLHFDHCGGCSYLDKDGELMVSFPNARHYVGKKQWENYMNPNQLEAKSFRQKDMKPVHSSGLLQLVEEDLELFPGFRIELYDGHTYDQLAVIFDTEDRHLVVPGDVIPTRYHQSDIWISAYDIEPLQSLRSKQALKKKYPRDQYTYIFFHDIIQ
jgi:Zn-dependent hydrolases, including glyoxylases